MSASSLKTVEELLVLYNRATLSLSGLGARVRNVEMPEEECVVMWVVGIVGEAMVRMKRGKCRVSVGRCQ